MDEMANKREHSVKVPRLYKVSANILRQHFQAGSSIKGLVYGDEGEKKAKHPNVKAIFALVSQAKKHRNQLEKVIKELQICHKFDGFLAQILICELIFGKKKLSGNSKPVLNILENEERIKMFLNLEGKCDENDEKFHPRYVRINVNKIEPKKAVKKLAKNFNQILYDPQNFDYSKFLDLVRNLGENDFLSDFHVENLLIFHPKVSFYEHNLYQNGSLILQDKASCFPVNCIFENLQIPDENFSALDACAAPGMKTTHLSAAMKAKKGRVLAVERDAKRFQTLEKIIEVSGCEFNTKCINEDFLRIDPMNHEDVKLIILDPSCSGSGMESDRPKDAQRLQKLSFLQKRLLLHALSFPKVLRVAYSTCSIWEEENENVVKEAIKEVKSQFKLIKCMENWPRRGFADACKKAHKFIRVKSDEDFCTGFFVAIFERK